METAEKKFFSAKRVTYLAVLLALVVVLQAVGGTIPIGVVQLNFTLIPIALGATLLGWAAGGILGLACGIVVLIQVITGQNAFYTLIWTNSPFVTTLTCLLKTTVAGIDAGLVFGWIQKKNRYVAVFAASGLVPVLNTAIFILGCLGMYNTVAMAADGTNVFVFILVGLVTYNFFIEFAINLLLAPAIHTVDRVVEKQLSKN